MAQQIAWGKVVLAGVLAGGVFGVTQGLLRDNLWLGLALGAVFGVTMALVMRRTLGSTALRGLDRRQRRTVSRAMRRGGTVEDARLARPLVEQADVVLATPYPVKSMRVLFVVLGLFGLLLMVLGSLDGGVAGLGSGVLLVILSALLVFVVIPAGRRQRERIRRSQELTRERHGLSDVA